MNAKLHLSQTLELSDRFVDSSQSIDASQEIVHSGEVFELDEFYIHLREHSHVTTLHSTEAFVHLRELLSLHSTEALFT